MNVYSDHFKEDVRCVPYHCPSNEDENDKKVTYENPNALDIEAHVVTSSQD